MLPDYYPYIDLLNNQLKRQQAPGPLMCRASYFPNKYLNPQAISLSSEGPLTSTGHSKFGLKSDAHQSVLLCRTTLAFTPPCLGQRTILHCLANQSVAQCCPSQLNMNGHSSPRTQQGYNIQRMMICVRRTLLPLTSFMESPEEQLGVFFWEEETLLGFQRHWYSTSKPVCQNLTSTIFRLWPCIVQKPIDISTAAEYGSCVSVLLNCSCKCCTHFVCYLYLQFVFSWYMDMKSSVWCFSQLFRLGFQGSWVVEISSMNSNKSIVKSSSLNPFQPAEPDMTRIAQGRKTSRNFPWEFKLWYFENISQLIYGYIWELTGHWG